MVQRSFVYFLPKGFSEEGSEWSCFEAIIGAFVPMVVVGLPLFVTAAFASLLSFFSFMMAVFALPAYSSFIRISPDDND